MSYLSLSIARPSCATSLSMLVHMDQPLPLLASSEYRCLFLSLILSIGPPHQLLDKQGRESPLLRDRKSRLLEYKKLTLKNNEQAGDALRLIQTKMAREQMSIATVVTVAEILKNNGFAVEKKIRTLTVDMRDEAEARPVPKAKMEILLGKTERFDELMAAEAEERGEAEEQN
ncbi:alba DNA/RNA-binding protein [Actinidia rufa]|uniref:Alba DNA/RNA-binding protein n=1 Tax=Actinidia rufa TaxID=165716 RepID=A0A7J0GC53_9ERIC|nr:alba DNA/RNA-binding protein [Actinidia rufa]